jgi:multicomponent K+:H+ antiporter subunit D
MSQSLSQLSIFLGHHAPVLPIVIPLSGGAILIGLHRWLGPRLQRLLGLAFCVLLTVICGWLMSRGFGEAGQMAAAQGHERTWAFAPTQLGAWPAPFSIVLAMDPLALIMVSLSSVIGVLAMLSSRSATGQGPYFAALIQFQLMGIHGAFLTADMFNLFVFFEVLLIASYGLLLHGGGRARLTHGIHYITLNLTGSALFLIGASLIYGVTGTLNMADIGLRLGALPVNDERLAHAALLVLMLVFVMKAAALPLNFWLPGTYAAAAPACAAVFALLTKVGLVSVLRLDTIITGPWSGSSFMLLDHWLLGMGLAGLVFAQLGLLASRDLGVMVGFCILGSSSSVLAAFGFGSQAQHGAAIFYMLQSTLAASVMFLLVPMVREHAPDLRVGAAFFLAAIFICSVPPSPGFIAKLALLQGAMEVGGSAGYGYAGLLISYGLIGMICFARLGSVMFWKPMGAGVVQRASSGAVSLQGMPAICLGLALLAAITVQAGSVFSWAQDAAAMLAQPPVIAGEER